MVRAKRARTIRAAKTAMRTRSIRGTRRLEPQAEISTAMMSCNRIATNIETKTAIGDLTNTRTVESIPTRTGAETNAKTKFTARTVAKPRSRTKTKNKTNIKIKTNATDVSMTAAKAKTKTKTSNSG